MTTTGRWKIRATGAPASTATAPRLANVGSWQTVAATALLQVGSGGSSIDVAAHGLVTPFATISYDSGTVTTLQQNQPHIVYVDDPTWSGGTVTYQAVRNAVGDDVSEVVSDPGIYLVGKITLTATAPAQDSGGGGGKF